MGMCIIFFSTGGTKLMTPMDAYKHSYIHTYIYILEMFQFKILEFLKFAKNIKLHSLKTFLDFNNA